jgi:hypothetical protein
MLPCLCVMRHHQESNALRSLILIGSGGIATFHTFRTNGGRMHPMLRSGFITACISRQPDPPDMSTIRRRFHNFAPHPWVFEQSCAPPSVSQERDDDDRRHDQRLGERH